MPTSPVNGVDPLIGRPLGQFEIVELIGRGGMGAVYKARQPSLDRWVAIKVLSPALSDDEAFVARFAREARAAAAVSHRNIIEIIDVAAAEGCHYIAMGYVDGESLAALVEREGRLPQGRALVVMKQTLAGLAAAHQAGIIHRDIKPSNILLDRSGEVRVSDFGLAKRLAADATTSTDEQPLGTPAYVSPEMATGREVDARTDLYSLGATFFHVLAGRPPFEGESFSDVIVKQVREPAPPLAGVAPDVDPRLCGIIDRLLRKDPAERYPSAQALLDDLEALGELRSPPEAARDDGRKLLRQAPTIPLTEGRRLERKAAIERLRRERGKPRKRWLLLAAAGAGVALLAALALPRLFRSSEAPSKADAAAELREQNAQSLSQNAKAAAAGIAKGQQAPVPPPIPKVPEPAVQVRIDEASRAISTDKIKVRWDANHANRIVTLELTSGPGLNLTTPVVLRPETLGGSEFTGAAWIPDDTSGAGILVGPHCEAQQWTSRHLDATRRRALVTTSSKRAGHAPVETSFWFAADSARIDFERTFRFSLTSYTNRLNGLIPFIWYTNGLGLPFTYSRAGREPGRATAQGVGLPVADWDGRWADMGQIAYFHKPCGHAVTLFGDWDGQSKGSRAAPALSEMRTFASDVTIRGALFLHEQGLAAEEIEKEYDRFLKQFSHGPAVEPPPPRVPPIVYSAWPFDDAEAKRRQAETAKTLGVPVEQDIDLGGGVKMTMVLIPAGEFLMGSPPTTSPEELQRLYGGQPEWYQREFPQHRVSIAKPFWLGKTEVTQEQWQAVMGNNPSRFAGKPQNPVEQVSWNDCQQFVQKLRAQTKGIVRLPTEAEWEYACRAGSARQFPFGDNAVELVDHAWLGRNSGGATHPVGGKKPNAWGLHDMEGNVWEWCQDWFGPYSGGDQVDPTGPPGGWGRVLRGGSWNEQHWNCRSAFRVWTIPAPEPSNVRGCRVVLASATEGPNLQPGALEAGPRQPRPECRLLATLTGHADWVTSVAFSPDGSRVASASRDRTVKLWEPATGKCLKTFQGHLGWAECVAFSPDGQRLASASMDGTVRVWDVETARCLVTLDHQRIPVRALAFPPDGKGLASGADDGLIRFWDVAAEKCLKTMTDPAGRMQVQFLAFSADGKRILTCGTDGIVRLWDAATGACLRKQAGLTPEIWCVGFSPDGQRMLSVGTDPAVRVWSADTGAALKALATPTVNRGVSFSPDGRWIAASGWQGWLHFWDAATYERLESLRGHQADIFRLAFSPDSKRLASAGFDNLAKVWALEPPAPAEEDPLAKAGDGVSLFDGKTLDGWRRVEKFPGAYAGPGGQVRVADGQIRLESGGGHTAIAWTREFPDSDYEITAEAMRVAGEFDIGSMVFPIAGSRCIWMVGGYGRGGCTGLEMLDGRNAGSNETTKWTKFEVGRWYAVRLRVTKDRIEAWIDGAQTVNLATAGHRFADRDFSAPMVPFGIFTYQTTAALRNIRMRRVTPGPEDAGPPRKETLECRLAATLAGHRASVLAIAFSPDSTQVATGSQDRTVGLWDTASGKRVQTFQDHTGWVEDVAFSPDGRALASASHDKTIRLWDLKQGRCIKVIEGHAGPVVSVAWFADGKRLLSGSEDSAIKVWDTQTGQCVRTLSGHKARAYAILSSDGSRVFSCSFDGTIRVWDLATGRAEREFRAGKCWGIARSPDDQRLASVGGSPDVKVWNTQTGECLRTLSTPEINRGVAFSSDGKWIAAGMSKGQILFWNATTYRLVQCHQVGYHNNVSSIAFSPDGKRLAAAISDNVAKVWAIAPRQGEPEVEAAPAAAPPKPLALPPGGQWLSLFDGKTLDGWRVVPGAGGERAGTVQVRDGQIVLQAGMPRTAIAWTGGFPTSDYEVRIEAARIRGQRDFCTIVFPLAATYCAWVVGGYAGDTTGMALFDGSEQACWNETAQRFPFQQGRWYQVRLRVTKARVQGWIGDEQVLDTLTAGHTFALWGFLQPLTPFSIYSHDTTAALRNISVRAITPGPDDGLRPDEPPAGAKPVESATLAVAARGAWFDTGLFVTQGKAYQLSASGHWGADFTWPGSGPQGQPWQDDAQFPLRGMVMKFGLIGRVGALGRPFHIGEKLALTPQTTGRLYLRMNDFNLPDNWGSLRVTVAGPLLADADAPLLARFTQEVRKLEVNAKSDWADSGVAVQPGQKLLIVAAGTWQAGPLMPPADADGYRDEVALLRRGALVGRIGEQGRPFYVGQLLLLEATRAGKLYLAMNDDARDDNQGSLTVTISSPPMPKAPDGKAEAPPPSTTTLLSRRVEEEVLASTRDKQE